MNQGIFAALLSVLFYLTSLFSGGQAQPVKSYDPPMAQQSYAILGQGGTITAERVTIRHSPSTDGKPLGTVTASTKVTVLDEVQNWYKIRPSAGPDGWVPNYALNLEQIERAEPSQEILAFYSGGELAYDSLLENGSKLTGLVSLGWKLDSYGGLTVTSGFDPEEMGRSLYFAGNQEMDTFANVSLGASPTPLLKMPSLAEKSIQQILSAVQEWGLKGVLINIDYLPGPEQEQLFSFIERLAAELQSEGLKAMLALPWDASLDYKTASQTVDFIILKHMLEPSPTRPGPIEPLPQMEAMLSEITKVIPANQVILRISTGGIKWTRSGMPEVIAHQDVLELAARQGANIRWDGESRTPYFQSDLGQEVWFENRYSLKYKIDLAKKYNLGGLAVQDLGQEDGDIWTHLEPLVR